MSVILLSVNLALLLLVVTFLVLVWRKYVAAEDVVSARNMKIDELMKELNLAMSRVATAVRDLSVKQSELAEISLRNRFLSEVLLLVAKLAPDRPSLSAWNEEEHERFVELSRQLGMKPDRLGFRSVGAHAQWRRDFYMREARRVLVNFRERNPGSPVSGPLILERLVKYFTRSGYNTDAGLSIIQARLAEFAPGAQLVRRLQNVESVAPPMPPTD